MTVLLANRSDIDLAAVRRVAWEGEDVEIAEAALARIGECRRGFLALLDAEPELTVYGVTSGYGERAKVRLTPEERRAQGARPLLWAGASFGDPLPARLTRTIVLARLANFLEGNAAVRPEVAQAVAGMLDGRKLPDVPANGNGDAGEIVALSRLFSEIELTLEEKESLALINGSPCAAAALADAALGARNRLRLAHEVFALSVEALAAPLEAYAPELDELWGDEHETAALRALRAHLDGAAADRRAYQAPVSYRILPRVLGEAHRAVAAAELAAEVSLRSVTDNPVYVPPDAEHPHGRVWSTGGYHNGQAAQALDRLGRNWADLCQLAERHGERLIHEFDLYHFGGLLMVQVGHSERARTAAQPTILPRGGFAQNDVSAPGLIAWVKEREAADAFVSSLGVLALLCAQSLEVSGRLPADPLRPFLAEIRAHFPPVTGMRMLGDDAGRLAESFSARVYA